MEGNMRIITSGRYDPPHLGHFCNIARIYYDPPFHDSKNKMTVFLLDYPERRYPVNYCGQALKEAVYEISPNIEVRINKTHFGKISKEELDKIDFDLYCGGNLSVLSHLEKMGVNVKYFERAYNFEASKYPNPE